MLGRLSTPEQFGDIIIKVGEGGRFVRLRDVPDSISAARTRTSIARSA
jgi:multidrug efflux pump subunit AcrB